MNKNESIHKLLDLVLELQKQGKNHTSFEVNYSTVEIRVQRGERYSAEKDYFLNESFHTGKIEGSERFERTLKLLEALVNEEEQNVLQRNRA